MNIFTEIFKEQEQYRVILQSLKSGTSPIRISGTCETQKLHLAFSLCDELSKNMLYIVPDALTAKFACQDLEFFYKDNVMYFPPKDIVFYNVDAKSNQTTKDRIKVLSNVLCGEFPQIIVTTIDALSQKVVCKDDFIKNSVVIKENEILDIEQLEVKFSKLGYKREANVEFQGQFSIRGGIVDIFTYNANMPYRIEFWDDEVDSIKTFDHNTQLSTEKINSAFISPAEDDFKNPQSTLCEYLKDCIVFYDEPHRIADAYEKTFKELADSLTVALENGLNIEKTQKNILYYIEDYNKLLQSLNPNLIVGLSSLSTNSKGLAPKEIFSITAKSMPTYGGNLPLMCDDLNHYLENQYRVIIPCGSDSKLASIKEMLEHMGIKPACNPTKLPKRGTATLVTGILRNGFEYPLTNCAIFSDNKLSSKEKTTAVKFKRKSNIRDITDINVGDYVVHYAHGIGIYRGIHQLCVDNVVKDYIKIQYKGADMLYVPVNQLDMVNKYIGTETGIKINKLGGTDWVTTKNKVSDSLEVMAKDLVDLYAKRESTPGFSFSPDCEYQQEFEDTFIYRETEDQIKAISDVKKDMESPKPMDRLLCGDVGYGKTEVAIRAAFKAVLDSKQVAYLVPTTLLAKQHYDTFSQRMKDFPIKVEMMCRFRSKKQQDMIVSELKNGDIDIIIGTHRLLQKDIAFKDLGLLIVDEEQRFGVTHKEKIKELKNNIDVLTLTATPIPRTLNMAMTGLRDMSILNDPPNNRYPVQTYVMEYDESTVKNAIKRELARNGQVFYLFNRVEKIERVATKLSKIIPDARIAYAHGKMSEKELESIMISVINKEYDVLVCTTIIETGLDIPNMNTIIIDDADHFGLSQLYQLRGRVGRSSKLAYAYLFVQKNKILDEVAEKRLKAIKEFTEFGSGIKIAMRDLEIRGAGSVLGKRQHGHMNQVGYDLYCKLLDAAVKKLKENKENVEVDLPVTIDLSVSSFIPSNYIEDLKTRVDIYKTIASIETLDDSFKVIDELIDRFGNPPQSVLNLIDSAMIRNAAKSVFVTDITQKGEVVYFKLSSETPMNRIISYISKNRVELYLISSPTPLLAYKPVDFSRQNICKSILKILNEIYDID